MAAQTAIVEWNGKRVAYVGDCGRADMTSFGRWTE